MESNLEVPWNSGEVDAQWRVEIPLNLDLIMRLTSGEERLELSTEIVMRRSNRSSNIPPLGANPGHLNSWRLDRSSFRPLGTKMALKCTNLSSDLSVKRPSQEGGSVSRVNIGRLITTSVTSRHTSIQMERSVFSPLYFNEHLQNSSIGMVLSSWNMVQPCGRWDLPSRLE